MTRASIAVAIALSGHACWGQSTHLNRLLDHWRWMAYWQGATELTTKYQAGAELQLLLFWPKDPADPGLGFCSPEIRVCQFYPNPAGDFGHSDLTMFPTEEPRQSFSRFVEEVLGQKAPPPKPKDSDYLTESAKVTLPALGPLPGVSERKMPPRDQIEALAAQFGCSLDRPDCKNHLLIPFFNVDAELWTPVYSVCAKECESTDVASVTFFQWIRGAWWRGVTTSTKDPNDVKRIRGRIEEALLVEVAK